MRISGQSQTWLDWSGGNRLRVRFGCEPWSADARERVPGPASVPHGQLLETLAFHMVKLGNDAVIRVRQRPHAANHVNRSAGSTAMASFASVVDTVLDRELEHCAVGLHRLGQVLATPRRRVVVHDTKAICLLS